MFSLDYIMTQLEESTVKKKDKTYARQSPSEPHCFWQISGYLLKRKVPTTKTTLECSHFKAFLRSTPLQ